MAGTRLPVLPESPGAVDVDTLAVVSRLPVFTSIQGEGVLIGVPMVFLRLYGCDKTCSMCDTTYSWTNPERNRLYRSVDDMADEIENAAAACVSRPRWLSVTGGEPTLQAPGVTNLLYKLRGRFLVNLETNAPQYDLALGKRLDFVSYSPKVYDLQHESRVREWLLTSRDKDRSQFKVVVTSTYDVEIAASFGKRAIGADVCHPHRFVIQPEASLTHKPDWRDVRKAIVDSGYRTIPQVHKTLGLP